MRMLDFVLLSLPLSLYNRCELCLFLMFNTIIYDWWVLCRSLSLSRLFITNMGREGTTRRRRRRRRKNDQILYLSNVKTRKTFYGWTFFFARHCFVLVSFCRPVNATDRQPGREGAREEGEVEEEKEEEGKKKKERYRLLLLLFQRFLFLCLLRTCKQKENARSLDRRRRGTAKNGNNMKKKERDLEWKRSMKSRDCFQSLISEAS